MQGFALSENSHLVNVLAPVDINGGATGDVFTMANYERASIVISLGVTGGTSVVTVNECTSFAAAGATGIPFRVYKEETAAGDTLDSGANVAAAGFTTSANDGIFYVLEILARDLSDASPFLQLAMATPGAITFACAVAYLTGARYRGPASATAIA